MAHTYESPPPGEGRARNDCVGLPSTSSEIAPKVACPQAVYEAAADYQKSLPRKPVDPGPDRDELGAWLRRDFVSECLDTLPRDAVAAQLCLERGDDERVFLYMQRIVLAVREAARTVNELRKGAP